MSYAVTSGSYFTSYGQKIFEFAALTYLTEKETIYFCIYTNSLISSLAASCFQVTF